jgi:hypothetical protein
MTYDAPPSVRTTSRPLAFIALFCTPGAFFEHSYTCVQAPNKLKPAAQAPQQSPVTCSPVQLPPAPCHLRARDSDPKRTPNRPLCVAKLACGSTRTVEGGCNPPNHAISMCNAFCACQLGRTIGPHEDRPIRGQAGVAQARPFAHDGPDETMIGRPFEIVYKLSLCSLHF